MPRFHHQLPLPLPRWLCLLAALVVPLTGRADPTGEQQYWLQLLNQARSDPAGELGRLVNYDSPTIFGSPPANNPDVVTALNYFGVSAADLAAQWSTIGSAAPVAWNDGLANSAATYSQVMVNADQQSHTLDGLSLQQRTTAGGYSANYLDLGENLYAAAKGVEYAHAGFLIDWGDSDNDPNNGFGNGIQMGTLHRAISFDPAFKEVGIGIAKTIPNGNTTAIGPYVVTQHFGGKFRQVGPKFISDAILTGVVFDDNVLVNNFYTPGEGIAGAAVLVFDDATNDLLFSGATNSAGGFNIDLPGVTAGEVLRVEVPGYGLGRQTAVVSMTTTDPSVYGVPVDRYLNIGMTFAVTPEPGGIAALLAAGLIFTCKRRRFCFDKGAWFRTGCGPMKVISSLIIIAALSSCVAKPWMVGSVNDHYSMDSEEAGRPVKLAPIDGSGQVAAPAASSAKEVKKLKNNPVGHTSSNPLN